MRFTIVALLVFLPSLPACRSTRDQQLTKPENVRLVPASTIPRPFLTIAFDHERWSVRGVKYESVGVPISLITQSRAKAVVIELPKTFNADHDADFSALKNAAKQSGKRLYINQARGAIDSVGTFQEACDVD